MNYLKEFKQTFWSNFRNLFLTSGAINAIVPNNCPWNSPAPVPFDANLAAAPKSAILNLWPVLSISKLAPVNSIIKILLVGFLLKAKGWTDILPSFTSKLWIGCCSPTPISRKSRNQGQSLIMSHYAWITLHTAGGCPRDLGKQSNFQSKANTGFWNNAWKWNKERKQWPKSLEVFIACSSLWNLNLFHP